jgi:hypothetical protein
VSATNASRVTTDAARARWIDQRTRAVAVDFLLYSPDAGLVGAFDLLFEVAPGGVVFPAVAVSAFLPDRFPIATSADRLNILLQVRR